MKAGDPILRKCLVGLLLVFYLVIAATYLFYLPKYSSLRYVRNDNTTNKGLVINLAKKVKNRAADLVVLLKQTNKSATDTKRELMSMWPKLVLLPGFVVFGIAGLFTTSRKMYHIAQNIRYSSPGVYLSCCSLRI